MDWNKHTGISLALALTLAVSVARGGDEETQGLYETLLEANSNAKNDALDGQIHILDALQQSAEQASSEALEQNTTRHEKSSREMLESLAQSSDTTIAAEANFRLAQLERETNREKALGYSLRATSLAEKSTRAPTPLRTRMHLLAGELLLGSGKKSEARSEFNKAQNHAVTSEEKIRAAVGAADLDFAEYKYEAAQSELRSALGLLKSAPASEREKLTPFRVPLAVRMIWASFRGGRYDDTLAAIEDSFATLPPGTSKFPAAVEADLVRAGGVSLYEKNNRAAFRRMANQTLAGDLGHRMILGAFETYTRAGRCGEVESLVPEVESRFRASTLYINFYEVRLKAAETCGDIELRQDLLAQITSNCGARSVWRTTIRLESDQEDRRSRLVREAAEEAGANAYALGLKSRSPADFSQSELFYTIRLDEHIAGENRGQLLLQAAQSALMANQTNSAKKRTLEALSLPLSEQERQQALHTLVGATRQELAKVSSAGKGEFEEYISAVDAYFKSYPADASARGTLFESALEAERRHDLAQAAGRLEQLLSEPATSPNGDELGRVTESLIRVYASTQTTSSALALEKLEHRLRAASVPGTTLRQVESANAAALRREALRLRQAGQLEKSVDLLLRWSSENPKNSESPYAALDAAKGAVEIGSWRRARRETEFLEQTFSHHNVLWESNYWKARALEAELSFLSAAGSYVKAAHDDASLLPLELRIDALQRAETLFQEIQNPAWEGAVAEKRAVLLSQAGSRKEAAQTRLLAAKALLQAGKSADAERLFIQAGSEPLLTRRERMAAELGTLEARLFDGFQNRQARNQLELLARRIAKTLKNNRDDRHSPLLLERALTLWLKENDDESRQMKCTYLGKINHNSCSRLAALENASRKLVARTTTALPAEVRARLLLSAEALRLRWCNEALQAATIASELTQKQRDTLVQNSDQSRFEMRRQVSEMTAALPLSHALRLTASLLLSQDKSNLEHQPASATVLGEQDNDRSPLVRRMFADSQRRMP